MYAFNIFIIALTGYLAGSIPTSIWTGKLMFNKDLREYGSGNAGATNTYRVLGWRPAVLVLLVDVTKGFLPTLFAPTWWFASGQPNPHLLQIVVGMAAISGHCYTLFAGFRGGKGVGTAAGMMLALFPLVVPFCLIAFVVIVARTRYVSLGSICAALTLPAGLFILQYGFNRYVPLPLLAFGFLAAAFIVFTHRSNIKRLLEGSETKIGKPR